MAWHTILGLMPDLNVFRVREYIDLNVFHTTRFRVKEYVYLVTFLYNMLMRFDQNLVLMFAMICFLYCMTNIVTS